MKKGVQIKLHAFFHISNTLKQADQIVHEKIYSIDFHVTDKLLIIIKIK